MLTIIWTNGTSCQVVMANSFPLFQYMKVNVLMTDYSIKNVIKIINIKISPLEIMLSAQELIKKKKKKIKLKIFLKNFFKKKKKKKKKN